MKREEVLKRAGQTGGAPDEMELDVLYHSNHAGAVVGLTTIVLLMVVKMLAKQPWMDLYAVVCLMNCGRHGYRWKRLKEKDDRLVTILWGISGLLLLAGYLAQIL